MAESKVLSNISYTIHNYSNYSIVEEETRNIVDVPYFPAQNLVDVSKNLNPYLPDAEFYFALRDSYDQERVYAFLSRTDARCLFIELAEDARYIHYQFVGNSYPQGRGDSSYTYDGQQLYMFGGYSDGRCMDDLWEFNIDTNTWTNLNFSFVESGVNESPSRRQKPSIVKFIDNLWLFGGETDVLTINSGEGDMDPDYANSTGQSAAIPPAFIVPLNDIWSFNFSSKEWTNYDLNRVLPHRPGNIIFVNSATIKILIKGGINEIGVPEPTAIWTIDIATDTVSNIAFAAPFEPSHTNTCLVIDGIVHILIAGLLYKWDDTNTNFVLVKSGISAINPETKNYWVVNEQTVEYGQQSTMGETDISVGTLYNDADVELKVHTITLPPRGVDIPFINIDNVQTFYYGGMITNQYFNESTYIMNHTTLDVKKYDFPETEKPTERVFPGLAYDKYRGRVYLFGGFDGTKFYNDLWYFDLGLKTWTKVHDQLENDDETDPKYPMPRQKSGMCVVANDWIYIIGGYSDIHSHNDFWKYNITTQQWDRAYLADDIPWGSQYYIFEWRDRLWLYNGQQLYRYFYELKQFKAQPLLIAKESIHSDSSGSSGSSSCDDQGAPDDSDMDPIAELITKKEYLNTPIRCTVISEHMIIQNTDFLFDVELESKVVTNYKGSYHISEVVQWMDRYWGVGVGSLSSYFINVSPLYPLTKNQIPHSYFYKRICSPLPDGAFYTDYGYGVTGGSRLSYQDNGGLFKIQGPTLPLNKGELYIDQKVSFCGLPSEHPGFDWQDDNAIADKTLDLLAQPTTYPYTPWFLYNKYKPVGSFYEGAQKVIWNPDTKRIYIVYKNGNTLKLNPEDNTFFVYFTKLWEGSAIGYHKLNNKIYAFGGLRNDRAVYMQDGMEQIRIVIPGKNKLTEQTHGGIIEFDLNINEMNLGSIESMQRERKVASVDYSITKEYLTGLVSHYLEGYANNTIPNSLDDVKEKIYLATQPLVDDLSQFDFVFEGGTRPSGRAYAISVQVGNDLYIFGGCECWKASCVYIQSETPYNVGMPGHLANLKNGDPANPIFDEVAEARMAKVFDMENRTWRDIRQLPEWRYMAGSIVSPDGRFIYIVGGFTSSLGGGPATPEPSNEILVYDIQADTYEKIAGIPKLYKGRANPLLYWLDKDRLMIMYGFYTYNKACGEGGDCPPPYCYFHLPVGDAWIYDKKTNIMYEAFKDLHGYTGIVAKDTFYIDEIAENENTLYILSVAPEISDKDGTPIMKVFKWNLINGEVDPKVIIPTTEIINDYNAFGTMTDESKVDQALGDIGGAGGSSPGDINLIDLFLTTYKNGNFRFRYAWMETYGEYNHIHMFIIGERGEESGIHAMEDIARGHKEAHLRFWYVDMESPEQWRYLHNIPYEYPLPLSPVALAYDGTRYIYCIYNKYNIWRLDFKNVIDDPSGSWWYRLPPCIDCNFLGDSRMEDIWDTYFIPPKYLTLQSKDGRMARMDVDTFTWFLDKRYAPEPPIAGSTLMSATGIDNNETYMYELGGISGKVMNVYEKQWDNFFFDMRATQDVVKEFEAIVSDKLWPTVLRRRRLYTINHLGHVFYSWLRIDGIYDVEFQLNDFYQGTEIRIYGDYTYLQNWDETFISVFDINAGWIELDQSHYTPITNEIGWDWDGEYARQYVRMFIDTTGHVAYQYSTQPPNYLSVDLPAALGNNSPISKIRVTYRNKPKPYNYMSRINKVELVTDQTILASYDDVSNTTPLSIVHIDPLTVDENYSNEFAVFVKNTGDETVKDVYTYAFDNEWLQFTLDPSDDTSWTIRTQETPFFLAAEILPGDDFVFYIRAVNIDQRPHMQDLVVKGVYPYTGS